ncbi:hypothetical protein GCM10027592_56270 [Spirosoma flavus]
MLTVKALLTNVLCEKLSALPGQEAQKLATLKTLLSQQGINLAEITDAMVADLAAGQCAQVVTALTQPITGTDPVDTLEKLINHALADQLVNQVLNQLAPLGQCTTEAPPTPVEEANPGRRLTAYTIDPNRLFIAPDGRAVRLPLGLPPAFSISQSQSMPRYPSEFTSGAE